MLPSLRVGLRYTLAFLMIGAGILHFRAEDFFTQIVPPFLPAPRLLVWISGIAEITLGAGIIPASTRRWAGYGLVALFIAVFPANVYMAVTELHLQRMPSWFEQPSPLLLWLRLPLQLVFIAWALWASRPSRRERALAG